MKKLIIDTELYKGKNFEEWYFIVGEMDVDTKEITIREFSNHDAGIKKYMPNCDKIIGFNFFRYDVLMITYFNNGNNLNEYNGYIINNGYKQVAKFYKKNNTFYSWLYAYEWPQIYDLADNQFDLYKSIGPSLKNKYFKEFGEDIWKGEKGDKRQFEEWDYYKNNKEKCIAYLKNDLEATYKLYKNHDRHPYLNIKQLMTNQSLLAVRKLDWALFNKKITYVLPYLFKFNPETIIIDPYTIMNFGISKDNPEFWNHIKENDFNPINLPAHNKNCLNNGNNYNGGVHNVVFRKFFKASETEGKIYSMDFTSLYPNILVLGQQSKLFKLFTEASFNRYCELKHQTTVLKYGTKEDKVKREAMKLLLNSTFGFLPYFFKKNSLNNEAGFATQNWICRQGRVLIWLLISNILLQDPEAVIININTDGVFVQSKKDLTGVPKKVMDKSGFEVTISELDWFLSRDVNNHCYKIKETKKIVAKGIYKPSKQSALLVNNKKLSLYPYEERLSWLKLFEEDRMKELPHEFVGFAFEESYRKKLFEDNMDMVEKIKRLGIELDKIQWTLSYVGENNNSERFVINRKKEYAVDTQKISLVDMVNPFTSGNNIQRFQQFNSLAIKPAQEYVVFDDDDTVQKHPLLLKYKDKTLSITSKWGKEKGKYKLVFKNPSKKLWKLKWKIASKYDIEVKPYSYMMMIDKNDYYYNNNNVKPIDIPKEVENMLEECAVYEKGIKTEGRVQNLVQMLKDKGYSVRRCMTQENIIGFVPKCHLNKIHHDTVKRTYKGFLMVFKERTIIKCFCGDTKCIDYFKQDVTWEEQNNNETSY